MKRQSKHKSNKRRHTKSKSLKKHYKNIRKSKIAHSLKRVNKKSTKTRKQSDGGNNFTRNMKAALRANTKKDKNNYKKLMRNLKPSQRRTVARRQNMKHGGAFEWRSLGKNMRKRRKGYKKNTEIFSQPVIPPDRSPVSSVPPVGASGNAPLPPPVPPRELKPKHLMKSEPTPKWERPNRPDSSPVKVNRNYNRTVTMPGGRKVRVKRDEYYKAVSNDFGARPNTLPIGVSYEGPRGIELLKYKGRQQSAREKGIAQALAVKKERKRSRAIFTSNPGPTSTRRRDPLIYPDGNNVARKAKELRNQNRAASAARAGVVPGQSTKPPELPPPRNKPIQRYVPVKIGPDGKVLRPASGPTSRKPMKRKSTPTEQPAPSGNSGLVRRAAVRKRPKATNQPVDMSNNAVNTRFEGLFEVIDGKVVPK